MTELLLDIYKSCHCEKIFDFRGNPENILTWPFSRPVTCNINVTKCNKSVKNPKVLEKNADNHDKGTNKKEYVTMGMAASQARLLTITARQHDVEYKAQSIQEAKLRLATQQDEVYQEYLAALDATTLTVKDWEGNVKTATFNNLCGINAIDIAGGNQYVFRDSRGALIVPDDVKNKYEEFKLKGDLSDPYAFAYFALGINDEDQLERINNAASEVANKYPNIIDDSEIQSTKDAAFRRFKELVQEEGVTLPENTDIESYKPAESLKFGGYHEIFTDWHTVIKIFKNDKDTGADQIIDDELRKFYQILAGQYESQRYKLYRTHSQEIWEAAGVDIDQSQFEYYVKWFKAIEKEGGFCTSINDYNSTLPGNEDTRVSAANDSEWLQNMIKCGKITVDLINTDKKTGAVSFSSTGVPSDSILEYTTTTTIDKSAMAKAEAEYEHKNKQINQKDKQFDMDLSKLDTERSALAKQYDSLTKVIDDNIERTFGIFS